MATKHTATFQGHTWTRTSQSKVYTHMVVGRLNIADERAKAAAWARKEYATNLEYYKMKAYADVYTGTFANGATYTQPITDMERAAAVETLRAGVEGVVADRLREFDARTTRGWLTADGAHTMYSAGWTSRLDLAEKLAARTPGAAIVEVTR